MTAHHIADFLDLAFAAYDRKEFGIDQLSSLVHALEGQAKELGILEEARRIRREREEHQEN